MRTRTRRIADNYLKLVRGFPLRPIRNDSQHAGAVKVLVSIDAKPTHTADEQDYANTLAMLVKEYEKPKTLRAGSVVQRLQHLMSEREFNVTQLGKVIGSQPEASMVLTGKRELSKEHIRRLSAFFEIEPGYFL